MSYHNMFIAKLKHDGRWLVTHSHDQIQLTRSLNGRVNSVLLERTKGGQYDIRPVKYDFRSPISHFDYMVEEDRWARNKALFTSLIKTLKKVGMWEEFIANKKTFIRVNDNNKKSDKGKLGKVLSQLL